MKKGSDCVDIIYCVRIILRIVYSSCKMISFIVVRNKQRGKRRVVEKPSIINVRFLPTHFYLFVLSLFSCMQFQFIHMNSFVVPRFYAD